MDISLNIPIFCWAEPPFDVHGVPLTDETIEGSKKCATVLMGSIGGDAQDFPMVQIKPG